MLDELHRLLTELDWRLEQIRQASILSKPERVELAVQAARTLHVRTWQRVDALTERVARLEEGARGARG